MTTCVGLSSVSVTGSIPVGYAVSEVSLRYCEVAVSLIFRLSHPAISKSVPALSLPPSVMTPSANKWSITVVMTRHYSILSEWPVIESEMSCNLPACTLCLKRVPASSGKSAGKLCFRRPSVVLHPVRETFRFREVCPVTFGVKAT